MKSTLASKIAHTLRSTTLQGTDAALAYVGGQFQTMPGYEGAGTYLLAVASGIGFLSEAYTLQKKTKLPVVALTGAVARTMRNISAYYTGTGDSSYISTLAGGEGARLFCRSKKTAPEDFH